MSAAVYLQAKNATDNEMFESALARVVNANNYRMLKSADHYFINVSKDGTQAAPTRYSSKQIWISCQRQKDNIAWTVGYDSDYPELGVIANRTQALLTNMLQAEPLLRVLESLSLQHTMSIEEDLSVVIECDNADENTQQIIQGISL